MRMPLIGCPKTSVGHITTNQKDRYRNFDYLLLSPAVSLASKGASPYVNRVGLGFRELSKKHQSMLPKEVNLVTRTTMKMPSRVTSSLVASDHCPVKIEFA